MDAEHEFFLSGVDQATEKVGQRQAPTGPLIDGVRWRKLKTPEVKKKNSTSGVELSDIDAKRVVGG
jgi:hypothetical protein